MRRPCVGGLVGIGLWAASAVADACPFCKDALFSPGEGQALSRAAHAFDLSIVALAAVPFILVGSIAWLIVRSSRRLSATGREAARHEVAASSPRRG